MAQNPNNPPQASEPVMVKDQNSFSFAWYQWFASVVGRTLSAPVSSIAPASRTAKGTPGQISFDANYIYVCVAANSWKRVAIASF